MGTHVFSDDQRIKVCVLFLRNENPFRDKIKAAFEARVLDQNFRDRNRPIRLIADILGEEHPIAQEFIQLGLGMENQHNPNSFLAVHQEMLAKRGQSVLHKPRVTDEEVTFNTTMIQEPRPRGDAKLILKSHWKQMVTNLEAFRTQQKAFF